MTGFIGILMLDTAFERVLGDAGNPASYHFPARTRVVENADSTLIVRNDRPEPAMVAAFCTAAQKLETEGAIALTSTCGFLVTAQDEIARSVHIPVMLSALSLLPLIWTTHGSRPVGVMTASSKQLGPAVLDAAGIQPEQAVIAGLQDEKAFASCFLMQKSQQLTTIDQPAIQAAVVAKAIALCQTNPGISAILLECGNLPPYASAIKAATGKPVYSILDGARLLVK
ncbi:hypothetical protein [Granulosicoccus antarcticus]|uniref:Glutamate racemase n=1 Tax=Granulosicoccus antarcticus IMCC3135 TaxID=1192854 RepID=A0A2Z2NT24_9GAMM|nr:hypothetical protein [Granulosicoccus antarcticus]ASJ70747.1 hypothetical protein IMCC3135_03170 [Granulosicoccus antarcticus IMCC3135]